MATTMRQQLLQAVLSALEPQEHVLALWEGGSSATGRADEWSDLDLQVLVQDGTTAATVAATEAALRTISEWDLRYEVPQPTSHGHWQAFYRLEKAGPYLQIDLVVMEQSKPNRLLEPELHGTATVYFDKIDEIRPTPADAVTFAARLQQRLPILEVPAELFSPFVDKELHRGRDVDALHFYLGIVVPRLVEALRMRYAPWRHNFGLRYLAYDLPPAVYQQVHRLVYVAAPAELPAKKEEALALLRRTLADLKALDLQAHLEAHR